MSCCETEKTTKGPREATTTTEAPEIVDYKVATLIGAGAAMAANCEPCLNKLVPRLIEAGVSAADIQTAVTIGQSVKERPAAIMKEAADLLTGTQLSEKPAQAECPIETLRLQEAAA